MNVLIIALSLLLIYYYRIIRQTFEIVKQIIDVVFLLIFFILVMALIGKINCSITLYLTIHFPIIQ